MSHSILLASNESLPFVPISPQNCWETARSIFPCSLLCTSSNTPSVCHQDWCLPGTGCDPPLPRPPVYPETLRVSQYCLLKYFPLGSAHCLITSISSCAVQFDLPPGWLFSSREEESLPQDLYWGHHSLSSSQWRQWHTVMGTGGEPDHLYFYLVVCQLLIFTIVVELQWTAVSPPWSWPGQSPLVATALWLTTIDTQIIYCTECSVHTSQISRKRFILQDMTSS